MLAALRKFLFADLEEIKTDLKILVSRKKQESTDALLMRHLLGSIDLKDLKPLDFKENEQGLRKDFAASIAIVTPKAERIFKDLIDAQKEYALTHDSDPMFAKGTINGIFLCLDQFQAWRSEHLENTKPKEDFDPHATLPELLERVSRASGGPYHPPI
jgi:hypothetical protein